MSETQQATGKEDGQVMNKPTIIIADNSNVMRQLNARSLEKNYKILEADSGSQLLTLIKDNIVPVRKDDASGAEVPFGLLVLSVELADYDGFEIARRIRKQFDMQQLPIILSTSHNKRDLIEKALEAGINGYLVKPFPQELLVSKVDHLLNREAEDAHGLSAKMSDIPIFKNVPPTEVAHAIDSCARVRTLGAGEVICRQGEENYDLYILLEGSCNVFFNGKKVSEIGAIDTIGEMGFLAERPRSAEVVTKENTDLLVFNKEQLDEFLNKDRAISEIICKNVIRTMSERLSNSNRLVEQLKILTAEQLTY
jgi:CheY-like chemotaxis protein